MLDVIHFFFEEDSRYSTAEEAKAVESLRTSLYETIYQTKYNYKATTNENGGSRQTASDFPMTSNEVKPYIPPTEFDPNVGLKFGNNVEAPLG